MPALLFHCDGDDGQVQQALRDVVQQQDPDIDFRVWPATGNTADIRYVAVWNPPDALFENLPELRAVFALSAGVDRLLENPALPADVPVLRLEDAGMAVSMGEYVLYGVLHAHRQFPAYAAAKAARRWDSHTTAKPAQDVRVGILGAGVLGVHVATLLTTHGYRVTCWSRRPRQLPTGVEHCHGPDALQSLAAHSDVLVCLLPLTEATRGVLNAALFAAMPAGGFVINAARGAHLIDDDLQAAIESGHLSGALLDVMRSEPPSPTHAFWDEARILMTPHIAAPTPAKAAAEQVGRALAAVQAGQPAPGLVDRDSGY